MCDLAGEHVGLVTVGDGDDHLGVVGAGALEHVRVRGEAVDGANVQPLLQVGQMLGILVDNGDVVGFAGQVLGQRTAHLSRPQNDDLHAANAEHSMRRGAPYARHCCTARIPLDPRIGDDPRGILPALPNRVMLIARLLSRQSVTVSESLRPPPQPSQTDCEFSP